MRKPDIKTSQRHKVVGNGKILMSNKFRKIWPEYRSLGDAKTNNHLCETWLASKNEVSIVEVFCHSLMEEHAIRYFRLG